MGRIGEPKREIYIPVTPPAEPIAEPEPEIAPDSEPAPVGGRAGTR